MSAPKVPVLLWILAFYIVKKHTKKKRVGSLISANITNDTQVVFVFLASSSSPSATFLSVINR